MSEYTTIADLTCDTKGLSDEVLQLLLNSCESMINFACQDIFYEKDAILKFSGDDSRDIFIQRRPYLIPDSITKIEHVKYDGTIEEVDSDYYVMSDVFCIHRITGEFSKGLPFNYLVTCKVGREEGGEYYKPDSIKLAVIALATNILDENYSSTSGTSGIIATPIYKFTSESITNYSYTLKNMQQINLQSQTPFGIPFIDNLIAPYRAKCANVGIIKGSHSIHQIKEMYL